jgi:catechol 2,3-dioxygenase-like lactoylglutathione lyase family enzyme
MRPVLTHLALGVRDLDRTIAFYRKHVQLHVVHERVDGGMRVVWLGEDPSDVDFVIVLLPVNDLPPPGPASLRHLGFAVRSRQEVDAAAAAARADGILVVEPVYAGPVVGYFCIVSDPDGNHVEFSCGQPINPRELPRELPRALPRELPGEPPSDSSREAPRARPRESRSRQG